MLNTPIFVKIMPPMKSSLAMSERLSLTAWTNGPSYPWMISTREWSYLATTTHQDLKNFLHATRKRKKRFRSGTISIETKTKPLGQKGRTRQTWRFIITRLECWINSLFHVSTHTACERNVVIVKIDIIVYDLTVCQLLVRHSLLLITYRRS